MREGYISDADDMLHDIEEMDRRDKGILTDAKRDTIISVAGILGYTAADDEGVASLAGAYQLSTEDVKRALTEPRQPRSVQERAMVRFTAVVMGDDKAAL
jgi:hypothetical protein